MERLQRLNFFLISFFYCKIGFINDSPTVEALSEFLLKPPLLLLSKKLLLLKMRHLTFATKKLVVRWSKIGSWIALISISCMFIIAFTFTLYANRLASVLIWENAKAFYLRTKFSSMAVVWINYTFLASPSYCRTRSDDKLFQTWKQVATFATESASIGAAFCL